MSPELALRVNSLQSSSLVAFGAKRTLMSRAYRKRIYEYTPLKSTFVSDALFDLLSNMI
jgi:hypothetical protein